MDHEVFVAGGKARGEDQVGFISGAKVAGEEVGEDGSGGVEGGAVGFVLHVPFVLDAGELFGGVFSAEGEVSLSVVGLTVCMQIFILVHNAKT